MVEMPPLRPALRGASVKNANESLAKPCETISNTIHRKNDIANMAANQTAAVKSVSRTCVRVRAGASACVET
jgi:hypothetical protein